MADKEVDLSHAEWQTSSFSGSHGQCVQVAFLDGGHIAVRDSKNSHAPALTFTPGEWRAFVSGVKSGEFDL